MEAIIFCGIQASGKSSFYKARFFQSHVRISMDLLRTRNRENKFLDICIDTQQAFVVDNTNPTIEDRQKYIEKAKAKKYKIIGYYFKSSIEESIFRNEKREGKENIPSIGIKATYTKLQLPSFSEGFDELYYVELNENDFEIKEWNNEI